MAWRWPRRRSATTAVYDTYDGTVKAPLGTLYRPLYFEGGYAIHGSPYVPSYPDSHGCVRLSNVDMDWLFDLVGKGMPVSVFDTMDPIALFGGLVDPGPGRCHALFGVTSTRPTNAWLARAGR